MEMELSMFSWVLSLAAKAFDFSVIVGRGSLPYHFQIIRSQGISVDNASQRDIPRSSQRNCTSAKFHRGTIGSPAYFGARQL
jgi:hypothetical protein